MRQHTAKRLLVASFVATVSLSVVVFTSKPGSADSKPDCPGLPSHADLKAALTAARNHSSNNGGFDLDMWGTVVNRDGIVCTVAFTGNDRGSQWPGSRVISAQKANTANAFSLPALALSTANLYSAVQPGGSLYGLQHSNPVDTEAAYGGKAKNYGQPNDPMVGEKIGGVNVFGGGLGLYNSAKTLIGAIGVSGDTSCADHFVAWRTRDALNLDHVPGGVSGDNARLDNVVFAAGPWQHPHCLDAATEDGLAAGLPSAP
jgi:uncharacterized protein GlcG (DUF336 family)